MRAHRYGKTPDTMRSVEMRKRRSEALPKTCRRAGDALPYSTLEWSACPNRKAGGDSSRSRPARERPSDELSDNRHRQRWTPAGAHGRSAPGGHATALAVRVGTWLRDEEASVSARAARHSVTPCRVRHVRHHVHHVRFAAELSRIRSSAAPLRGAAGAPAAGLCVGTPARHGRATITGQLPQINPLARQADRCYAEPSSSLPVVQLAATTSKSMGRAFESRVQERFNQLGQALGFCMVVAPRAEDRGVRARATLTAGSHRSAARSCSHALRCAYWLSCGSSNNPLLLPL